MCDICDGGSADDDFERIDALIRDDFWTLQWVGPDGDQPAWCYTVGVTEVTGQSELVMVGACPQCAAGTLNRLGLRIRSGERFEVPTRYPVFRGTDLAPVHLRPVHPDHWDTDRFAMWLWYYRQRGWHPPRREAVQVVVPDDAGRFPWEPEAGERSMCAGRQLLLDSPPVDAR